MRKSPEAEPSPAPILTTTVQTVKSLKTGNVIEDRRTPASLQMSYLTTPASHKFVALGKVL